VRNIQKRIYLSLAVLFLLGAANSARADVFDTDPCYKCVVHTCAGGFPFGGTSCSQNGNACGHPDDCTQGGFAPQMKVTYTPASTAPRSDNRLALHEAQQ
jgi:hypothetical protein